MPTKLPTCGIVLSEELLERVVEYWHANDLFSRSATMVELIERGLQAGSAPATEPTHSEDALDTLQPSQLMPNAEKIRIAAKRSGVKLTAIAAALGMSRQNLAQKLNRDTFSLDELRTIAKALGGEYISEFRLPDGTIV